MAWNSSFVIPPLTSFFLGLNAGNEDVTAAEIAKCYGRAARTVMPKSPAFASLPLTLKPDSIIATGFSTSFKLARALQTGSYFTVNAAVWTPAATAIVTYWTGVTFAPMPPPPGGLVGATNVVVSPGLPAPLNVNIGKAFQKENAAAVAKALDDAFKKHLSTVTGLWSGTAPGTPPPPIAIPWSGLV